jgi:hypothetical protein
MSPGATTRGVFKSRIPAVETAGPGEKQLAPPGVFYMLERVTAETKNGITAVVPGDEVKLLSRNGNKLRVIMGATEFEVTESQVTNDIALAREAEKNDFLRRTGQR